MENKLYFLPPQRVDYLEQIANANFGINLLNPVNEQDFEDGDFAWYDNKSIGNSLPSVGSEVTDSTFLIKEFAKSPEFSYEGSEEKNGYQFYQEVSYNFSQNEIDILSLITDLSRYTLDGVEYLPDQFPVGHKIQYNSTSTEGSDDGLSDYDIIPKTDIDALISGQPEVTRFFLEKVEYRSETAETTDWLPIDLIAAPTQEVEISANYYSNLDYNNSLKFDITGTSVLTNFDVYLRGIATGNYQFRFTFTYEKLRWVKETVNRTNEDGTQTTLFSTGYLILDQAEGAVSRQIVSPNYNITPFKFTSWQEAKDKVYQAKNVMIHNESVLAYGADLTPQTVYGSIVENPGYFPQRFIHTFENDLQEKLNVITPFMEVLVAQSDSYTWGMKGDSFLSSFNPYQFFNINTAYGCIAPKTARPVRNQLFFLSKEGIASLNSLYAIDNQYNVKMMDRNIFNIVPLDQDAIAIQHDNQYWIHFPNTPDNMTLRYYYDKKAWVKDTYEQFDDFTGIFKYYNEGNSLRIITNPMVRAPGETRAIFNIETDKSLANDLGFETAPRTTFTTSYLNQNYPFHLKKFKEAKFDFTLQNEYLLEDKRVEKRFENFRDDDPEFVHNFTCNLERGHTYTLSYLKGLTYDIVSPDSPYTADTYIQIDEETAQLTLLGDEGTTNVDFFILNGDIRFTVPNTLETGEYILEFLFIPTNGSGVGIDDLFISSLPFLDTTYDRSIVFNIDITSEKESVLNDTYSSYQRPVDVSDEDVSQPSIIQGSFGEVTTLVKTVKLNGKGYNIKVSFDDRSKTKWVLETLGLTYKMRKARSR